MKIHVVSAALANNAADQIARADGHRAFVDDNRAAVQVRRYALGRRLHAGKAGFSAGTGSRIDGYKHKVGWGNGGLV